MSEKASRWRRFRRDRQGSSLVEFALITPVIAFGALLMVDIGSAIGERMELDQVVRAGAESAMINGGDSDALTVMNDVLPAGHTRVLAVDRICSCPDAPRTPVSCGSPCGATPPNVFVDMTARDSYHGIFLKELHLASAIRVQLR